MDFGELVMILLLGHMEDFKFLAQASDASALLEQKPAASFLVPFVQYMLFIVHVTLLSTESKVLKTSWDASDLSNHCGKAAFYTTNSVCASVSTNHNGELLKSMQKLCKSGRLQEALELIDLQTLHFTPDVFQCLLQSCIGKKDLAMGHKVHSLIRRRGFESNSYLGSHLIRLFDVCGSMFEANEAFADLPNPNVFAWSAIISAFTKHGQGRRAIQMYQKMHESNVQPDAHTFVAGLKACAREAVLIEGMLIHMQILEKCFDALLYVGNALIDMYGKCGSLEEARRLFDNQLERDSVTWNAILAGYVKSMRINEAFELFGHVLQEDKADIFTYGSILKACASKAALLEGSLTLLLIIESGVEQEEFLGSTVIDMYAKCGCLEDALCVFEKLSRRDLVVWNALIAGISQHSGLVHGYKTFEVFKKMMFQHGVMPDIVTFSSVLKACCSIGALAQAKFVHTYIVERGFGSDTLVLNTLISVYADCGRPYDAYKIFSNMRERDAITWNAIIAGYSQHGLLQEAFQLFQDSQQECGGAPDMSSWNALIAGYAQHGYGWEGIALFNRMQQEGLLPDKYTFIGVLNACACVGAAEMCRFFHFRIFECSLMSDNFVANSLIDMYAKCGILAMGRDVFDRSSKQHTVTWNAMIGGYALHGHHRIAHQLVQQMKKQECKPDTITWNAMLAGLVHYGNLYEAFQVLAEMLCEGTQPDHATFVTVVKGCSSVGALTLGKQALVYATASSLDSNIAVYNSCIDMYAKCGSLMEARFLFEKSPKRDRVTWNTIIAAHALHDEVKISLDFFECMQREGLKPDVATFAILLSACSRTGHLNEMYMSFKNMNAMYKVAPTLEHFNCLVDVFSRAGQLSEAENILKAMPLHTDIVGWIALLNNCNTYGNPELGRRCFDRVHGVDDSLGSAFVIMSNILANAGFWDDLGKIQALRKSSAAWKKPGMAFIEVKGKLIKFTVGESFHSAAIYEKMLRLRTQLKIFGVPDVKVLSEQPAP